MITKFYKATSGYFDLTPGKSELEFTVKTTDEGKVIMAPKGEIVPEFNEVQIDGDPHLRREYLPEGELGKSILFMDNPDYEALRIRRHAMATKQIPLGHDDCFVARWMALSNSTAENIERGLEPPVDCYTTPSGNWGGLGELSVKKSMLPYIKEMTEVVRNQLESAPSSAVFVRKFIEWRDTLPTRITYQPVDSGE